MTQLPGYYTVEEAAPILGIHPESVRRHIRGGKLAAYTVGNVQLIPALLLEAFAATYSPNHKTAAAKEAYAAEQVHMKRKVALGKAIRAIRSNHED